MKERKNECRKVLWNQKCSKSNKEYCFLSLKIGLFDTHQLLSMKKDKKIIEKNIKDT